MALDKSHFRIHLGGSKGGAPTHPASIEFVFYGQTHTRIAGERLRSVKLMSRNANAIALQTDEYKIQVKAEYLPYKGGGA